MRRGSTSERRASLHASSSTASAACAESDAARSVCRGILAGKEISPISAPTYADSRWRPGRCMTRKALSPARRAEANASFPCPMAEITPIPVTTGSGCIEFFQKEAGQLADVLRSEQLDPRQRETERLLHQHGDLGAVHGVRAEIRQAVRRRERVRVEPRDDLPRVLRDEVEDIDHGHDGYATVAAARPARMRRAPAGFPSDRENCRSACSGPRGARVHMNTALRL